MAADVDLDEPDGRRVHVSEVARGLGAVASVDLVVHGADPGLPGVRHVPVRPARGPGRIAALTWAATRTLVARRRRAAAVYLRHDPGTVPIALVARLLRYRLVLEVNAISVDLQREAPRGAAARLKAGVKAFGDRRAVRAAGSVVVVSAELRDSVARLRRDEIGRAHV